MEHKNQQIDEIAKDMISLIIDYPEELNIDIKEDNDIIILKVNLNKDDIGKVIGKKGQNLSALRTLLKAISVKTFRKRLIISLYEDDNKINNK